MKSSTKKINMQVLTLTKSHISTTGKVAWLKVRMQQENLKDQLYTTQTQKKIKFHDTLVHSKEQMD